jgi:hypothetical protein
MSTFDGGSAYPRNDHFDSGNNYHCAEPGMSLRDFFAAKALPVAWKAFEDGYFDPGEDSINEDVAACAYQMADAMLKERAK